MISLLTAIRNRKWIIWAILALAIVTMITIQQLRVGRLQSQLQTVNAELMAANGRIVIQNQMIEQERANALARDVAARKKVDSILSSRKPVPTETIEELNTWFAQPR